jgi:hypothetical protein
MVRAGQQVVVRLSGEEARELGNYSVRTRHSPALALERAVAFFGPDGYGLTVTQRSGEYVLLVGGGGHVAIVARAGEEGHTEVDIQTREWDGPALKFVSRIA